jgi:hypothetical protein
MGQQSSGMGNYFGFQNPGSQYGNNPGDYGWSPSYGYPNGGWGYNNRPPQQYSNQQYYQPSGQQATDTTTQAGPTAWGDNTNLQQAQRFANTGKFGRAKQQVELGGGNWDDYKSRLRTEAGANENYGGNWDWGNATAEQVAQAQRYANVGQMGLAKATVGADNWSKGINTQFAAERDAAPAYVKGKSMGFDWGDTTSGRLAEAKRLATAGTMGKAKQMYERGGGVWSKDIHRQMNAWAKGNK